MNDVTLNQKVKELRQLKRALEDIRQKMDAIESEVKEEMGSRKVDQIVTDDYKITWKSVSSLRLDTKSLKDERPEIYTRYAVPVESRRFLVT